MWNFKYKNQYLNYVSDLMQDTAVQSMRLLPQHRAGVSCYHHSVLVSYASWRVCDWLGLDARAAARGGLLHDFYLYNWRDAASHPGIRHGSQHPEVALRNARARFSLTWREEDIIRSHMFPLTLTKPHHTPEAVVVGMMDKLCALAERAFVRALDGGCSSPIAAYAQVDGDAVTVSGMYVDGRDRVWKGSASGPAGEAEALARELAMKLKEDASCPEK